MSLFKTNILDFEILDSNNLKNIIFVDASTYSEEPENPILSLLLPGSNKYLIANITPRVVNVLDSHTIGLSQALESWCPVDLPDGVYTYTYKICPYETLKITKSYLRTTLIDKDIAQIYETLSFIECCKDDLTAIKKELVDIYIFLESGKANATLGNIDKAGKDYSIACKKVAKLISKLCK